MDPSVHVCVWRHLKQAPIFWFDGAGNGTNERIKLNAAKKSMVVVDMVVDWVTYIKPNNNDDEELQHYFTICLSILFPMYMRRCKNPKMLNELGAKARAERTE